MKKEPNNQEQSHDNHSKYNFQDNTTSKDLLAESAAQYLFAQPDGYTLKDYYALPDGHRAELIDGELYDMVAPGLAHQTAAALLFQQLNEFIDAQGGSCLPFVSPVDVQLDCDDHTMVEPDVIVVCNLHKAIGRCIYGAPDLVMEILSPSTAKRDQTIKLEKYRNAGVREYWMIDLKQKKVIVYDFEHKSLPIIYGMSEPIPVQIYHGQCKIRFDKILARIDLLRQYET
ncbi:MAG: Uma2 family endonuclease [Lachnospiraceae bacterium]|nr:Uma2 family endonuclease [Lachnospiraceae bacterium]